MFSMRPLPRPRCSNQRFDVTYRMLVASLLVAVFTLFLSRGMGTHLLFWNEPHLRDDSDPTTTRSTLSTVNSSVRTTSADVPASPQPANGNRPNKDSWNADDGLDGLLRLIHAIVNSIMTASGVGWRIAHWYTPAIGATLWVTLVDGSLRRETLLQSRMSSAQRRIRRTTLVTKLIIFAGAVSALNSPHSCRLFLSASVACSTTPGASVATPAVSVGIGLLLTPMSMRATLVSKLPLVVIALCVLRSAISSINNHGDPFYYDKQISCEEHSGFLCFLAMVSVSIYALVDAPTVQVAAAAVCVHVAASLGSCRNDALEASAGLVHIGVLVALQHWSRKRARGHTRLYTRRDREHQNTAAEVSNWAAVDDEFGDESEIRDVECYQAIGGGGEDYEEDYEEVGAPIDYEVGAGGGGEGACTGGRGTYDDANQRADGTRSVTRSVVLAVR